MMSSSCRTYEGNLKLTGWEYYNFPKEMDRQEVRVEGVRV